MTEKIEELRAEAHAWLKTPYDTADRLAMDRQIGEAADIIMRLDTALAAVGEEMERLRTENEKLRELLGSAIKVLKGSRLQQFFRRALHGDQP